MTDGDSIDALIEAGSLGTPAAKAMREQGRRMMYGDSNPDMDLLYAIGEDFKAGRIDAAEACRRCLEAGCLEFGARFYLRLWMG